MKNCSNNVTVNLFLMKKHKLRVQKPHTINLHIFNQITFIRYVHIFYNVTSIKDTTLKKNDST